MRSSSSALALLRFGALAAAAALSGCSHYRLGTSPGRLDFTTLYVEPVKNKTLQPQLVAPLSDILRETFLQDGRVQLANSADEADATLSVVVVGYHREVAAAREQDTGLASKFAITLTTLCTLRDNRTGRAYFQDRTVLAERDIFTDNGNPHSSLVGDQLQAEYNIVPVIGEALAKRVAHTVLDVW